MVAMTEDGSEDWQAEPGRSSHTGEAMAQVMKPDIAEAGPFPDARPWPLQPHKPAADSAARNDVRVAFQARGHGEQGRRCGSQGNHLCAGLRVGQAQSRAL